MSNSLYANGPIDVVCTGGGCVVASIAAGSTLQLNGGTSIPCRVVTISQGLLTASVVRFGINASTSASVGAIIPTAEGGVSPSVPLPAGIEIPIDDVSKVWVYSAAAACLGISYRY